MKKNYKKYEKSINHFRRFQRQIERLHKALEKLDENEALDHTHMAATLGHHIFDHVAEDEGIKLTKSEDCFRNRSIAANRYLGIMHDICTQTKHAKVTTKKSKLKDGSFSAKTTASMSKLEHLKNNPNKEHTLKGRDILKTTIKSGRLDIIKALNETEDFWIKFFKEKGINLKTPTISKKKAPTPNKTKNKTSKKKRTQKKKDANMSKKYMTIFCDNISMINNRPSLEGIYIGGKMGISGQLPGDLDRLSIITLAPDLDKAYPNIDVSEDILTTVEFPDGRVINGRYHSPTDGSIPEMIGFDLSPFTITSTGDVKVYLHIKDEEPVLTGILKIIQNPD